VPVFYGFMLNERQHAVATTEAKQSYLEECDKPMLARCDRL
jgi:hypothetical protein